ncbi:hypothetical protein B5C34_02530 [Pacificimonas flava]|uniref:DUF3667 domain-containing protein n=2 Tax=Pacificimonas TaxID=1960290 RepID=A0A219B3N4_9SPHN|nr:MULTISPECIES: DUF3667 domain-containing protein [Pacificimonas]MBZ6377903.1 DUF3667 domain-containing protein [Pacificimonas aurantium]OWV32439.1 hypothetical protein B5C34_02530 [Pacificimonas flava]
MSETDAVGAFVTAGLVAGEVDGGRGRHASHAGVKHEECPNCGTPAPGHYCPECGQHVHVARSVRHILHEFVHGVLHLDGKFWRTLPKLIFKPGHLTRDYIEGKRARYVAPFGIFLFTIFAMYFTFAVFGPPGVDQYTMIDGETGQEVTDPAARAQTAEDLRAEAEGLREAIATLEETRSDLAGDGDANAEAIAQIDEELREQRLSLRIAERTIEAIETGRFDWEGQIGDVIGLAAEGGETSASLGEAGPEEKSEERVLESSAAPAGLEDFDQAYAAAQGSAGEPMSETAATEADAPISPPPGNEGEADVPAGSAPSGDASPEPATSSGTAQEEEEEAAPSGENFGWTITPGIKVNENGSSFLGIEKIEQTIDRNLKNKEFFWYKVKQSAYKFSFLLLPISLPFVWLLFFWRRDLHLYDHTVFILYSLSFMSLLTITLWVGMATGLWGWAIFWIGLVFIPPIHMYKQLKYGYALSRTGALIRTWFLVNFALIGLALFFATVVALGAL